MANNETAFRQELLNGFWDQHYHAHSVSEKFQSGIPDVWCSAGRRWRGWLELKFETLPKKTDTLIRVRLSELQRKYLRDERKSGGECGWILCVKGHREWFYFVGADEKVAEVCQDEWVMRRKFGEILDVNFLLDVARKRFLELVDAEDRAVRSPFISDPI